MMPERTDKNSFFMTFVLMVSIAILGVVAGLYLWTLAHRAPAVEALTVLPESKVISDFALIDQQEKAFSLENLRGQWSLLFFGFTSCPDICPTTLYELQRVNEILATELGDEKVRHQVVFVSVDPARDTAEKLADYVEYFDPAFRGVTGAEEQLAALTRQLGIAFQLGTPDPGSENYDVMHSSTIVLMDPDGALFGAFTPPHSAEQMARDLQAVAY